jgi:hypothetical protein
VSFSTTPGWLGGELAYAYDGPGWKLQGGLRAAAPFTASPLPLEVFVRFLLAVRVGPWEPVIGPELGLSGLGALQGGFRRGDFTAFEQAAVSPIYAAVHSAPLRFVFADRYVLSALELQVGTPLSIPGAALRVHLEFLAVGVHW